MAATNLIDSVQQLYAGLTGFSGKPADLWFGSAWPTRGGSFVGYPLVRFTHKGTDTPTDFEYSPLEQWRFTFEVFAETVQQALAIFDRVRFNGQDPGLQAGFWYASAMTMPAGYTFEAFAPEGPFRVGVRDGEFSPSGTPVCVVAWDMLLQVYRATFA